MVRFARAEGSKGSNKKEYEDATPWADIVSQLETNNKKRKKNQTEAESEKQNGILGQDAKKKKENSTVKQETTPQNPFQPTKDQKTDQEKGQQVPSIQDKVKKRKKGKNKELKTSEPQYTINSEGKRVKVFRDGTERTWFDLPYEENDTMTRYENMWVKKAKVGELDCLKAALVEEGLDKKSIMRKMMKAKRKAHQELRIELIYQQKNLVSEATGEKDKKNVFLKRNTKGKKNKKKKQKQAVISNGHVQVKKNKCKQLDEQSTGEKMNTEVEEMVGDDDDDGAQDDTKLTVIPQVPGEAQRKRKNIDSKANKNDRSKITELTMETLPKNENETEDKEEAVTPQPKMIPQVPGEAQRKRKNIDSKANKNNRSKIAKLTVETLPKNENETEDKEEAVTPQPKIENKEQRMNKAEIEVVTRINQKSEDEDDQVETKHNNTEVYENNASGSQGDFEENELMTTFEGYWVLRSEVEALEAYREAEQEAIYAARTDGSRGELTEEEEILLRRAMKKRKRFCNKKLLQRLNFRPGKRVNDRKGKKDTKNDDSEKVVKFDGFFVKKEAADRLHKLRSRLFKEGLSQQEVDKLVQKERRKEERVLKNERKLVCLNCRQPGHMVSACPNIEQADGEGQPSICYTCGSTEHISASCNLKKGSEKSFSFATCYICKESGHISRQCPDNPRGLYPRGGACRGCGSVEHLAKDCPDLQKENAENTIKVGRMKGEELEALDEDDEASHQDDSPSLNKWTKPKVVKFS